jgi:hypothetical protein
MEQESGYGRERQLAMDLQSQLAHSTTLMNSTMLRSAILTPRCNGILDEIMNWVSKSETARDKFMLWLFGPAGAGNQQSANFFAEMTAEKGLLVGTFFLSRTSPTRNTKDRLVGVVATLAYQLALSIPDTRPHIDVP